MISIPVALLFVNCILFIALFVAYIQGQWTIKRLQDKHLDYETTIFRLNSKLARFYTAYMRSGNLSEHLLGLLEEDGKPLPPPPPPPPASSDPNISLKS